MEKKELSAIDIDRIIEMAWEDRTPFEAITLQFQLSEGEVIDLMRREMKRSSFNMWRRRVQGRETKHEKLRNPNTLTFKSDSQRQISLNKLSKR